MDCTVLHIINTIFALIGGCIALCQWRQSAAVQRAQFVWQLLEKCRMNDDTAAVLHKLDYELNWYNEDFHNPKNENDKQFERDVDKLLTILNCVCYLIEHKQLNKRDASVFEYIIQRRQCVLRQNRVP